MAWVRLYPSSAAQPLPGSRLLQAVVTSRKYGHRVRCMRLPPMEAELRSWAEALSSRACVIAGRRRRTTGFAATSLIRASAPMRRPAGVLVIPRSGRRLMSTTLPGRSTVCRMRSTIVVPPARYRLPRAPAARASSTVRARVKVKGYMVSSTYSPCAASWTAATMLT
jgi:hypothetical protein